MTAQDEVRAREFLAQAIEAQGPSWQNCANLVRAGHSNVWINPALVAINRAQYELLEDYD